MRSVLALTIGVCAGCAKIEELEPPLPSFNVVDQGDAGITVTHADFAMHFFGGGAQALHFPDELTIGGSPNVLGGAAACGGNEQLVGLAMFPAFITTPLLSNPPASDVLTIPASTQEAELNGIVVNTDGPHVVQISLRYTVNYDCPNAEVFEGRTAFTFFPSGRIVRHDFDLKPTSTDPLVASGSACGCAGATNSFAFTSFWTFDDTDGLMAQRDGSPLTFTTPPNSDQSGTFDGLCTIYPDHAIAVSYAGDISRARNNASNFAHVFDFEPNDGTLPAFATPPDIPYEVTSAIQISTEDGLTAADCGGILEGLSEPAIRVDGQQLSEADADGIYNDFVEHEADFEIEAPVEALPPGWALRTTIKGSDVVKVVRDPPLAEGQPVVLLQKDTQEDVNLFIFYFPDGLAPGETITVELL